MPIKPPDSGAAASAAAPADLFDHWLSRDLHRLYSVMLAEPIPAELLRLIDEAAPATGPPPRERGPGRALGFEGRVRERAYFLWLEEGRPVGRAGEHWHLAHALQAAAEGGDQAWAPPGRRLPDPRALRA